MMRNRLAMRLFGLAFASLFAAKVHAQVSPWVLFDVPTDPRSAGLGGRMVATLNADPHAAIYSPALVDTNNLKRIAFDHVRYFGGMHASAVGYTWGQRGAWVFASGARYSGYGSFNETDATGQVIGSFTGGETVLQSTAAYTLNERWNAAVRGLLGFRNLDRETAGLVGWELGVHGRFEEQHIAVGAAITGWAHQFHLSGNQPDGLLTPNLQLGMVKGFEHAPFRVHVRMSDLQTWDLAPEGTYDPLIDPLTGDLVPSGKWAFGDQLMRHMGLGTELLLSQSLSVQLGFDYRRRAELQANGRTGTNGFSIGTEFAVKQFQLRMSRNTYHFAGSSTHLAINIPLSAWL